MMPPETFRKLMDGTISAHGAALEAAELAEVRRPFNEHLHALMGQSTIETDMARNVTARARLFGAASEPPRDEGGRFAPHEAPAVPGGMDGGARTRPVTEEESDRHAVHRAIETLLERRGPFANAGVPHAPRPFPSSQSAG